MWLWGNLMVFGIQVQQSICLTRITFTRCFSSDHSFEKGLHHNTGCKIPLTKWFAREDLWDALLRRGLPPRGKDGSSRMSQASRYHRWISHVPGTAQSTNKQDFPGSDVHKTDYEFYSFQGSSKYPSLGAVKISVNNSEHKLSCGSKMEPEE